MVPYVDVTGMKADLIAWCRDGARATAGRLVHGPGGLGKTRLMIEVAAALPADSWMAGFLDRPHDQAPGILQQRWQALDDLIANGDDNGLLMVLDYAEARQDEVKAIAERLSRRPDHDTRARCASSSSRARPASGGPRSMTRRRKSSACSDAMRAGRV